MTLVRRRLRRHMVQRYQMIQLAARNAELYAAVCALFVDKQRVRAEAETAHRHMMAAAHGEVRERGRAVRLQEQVNGLVGDVQGMQLRLNAVATLHRPDHDGRLSRCLECCRQWPCPTFTAAGGEVSVPVSAELAVA